MQEKKILIWIQILCFKYVIKKKHSRLEIFVTKENDSSAHLDLKKVSWDFM